MAEDMYSYIKPKQPKKRSDFSVAVIAAVGGGLLLFFILTMVGILQDTFVRRDFTASLSESTVYAYQNISLYAETEDGRVRITGENAYSLYYLFSAAKGKEQSTTPNVPPFVRLDYGDGAILECWEYELKDGVKRDTGIFWSFTDPKGNCWMFDSDTFSIANIERLIAKSANFSQKTDNFEIKQ